MSTPEALTHHLASIGLSNPAGVRHNLPPAELAERAIRNEEAQLSAHGPLVTQTDPHTGRSPNDRFVVRETETEERVGWGDVNKPVSKETFNALRQDMGIYAEGKELYIRDCFAGADPRYRYNVRVITEKAWHNLFAYNMFLRPTKEELRDFKPDFTVIDFPDFKAEGNALEELHSSTFILLHLTRGLVLIGGTHYAGEIKKSIFSALNFLLPEKDIFPMHCSANVGEDGRSAVFFGLSGTGKTTLSADARRTLIGDDEHGWSADGVFNFEGGCYAKAINLSAEGEPEIYATTRQFGTIAENVILRDDRSIDFEDASITQNTRLSYPIWMIPNASETGMAPEPDTVIFLAADAFGVLPPISKLTPEQAMYHFLSGYTAKVAGTERGVTEPKATFSACFGEPFMVRPPGRYAEMLGERIKERNVNVFLVNTGWTGGPCGTGKRMKLAYTRRMVEAALAGELDNVETSTDPVFGVGIPAHVESVPDDVLIPRNTWEDPTAYDEKAHALARMFAGNFEKYANDVDDAIREAGPVIREAA